MSFIIIFLSALVSVSVFSLLVLKLHPFSRKKIILRVFIASILMVFLIPLLFIGGFHLSRIIRAEYTYGSIWSQCKETLHQCVLFVNSPTNLYMGFKIFLIILFLGVFLVTSRRVFYYMKGYWILKRSSPINLSLYPKLKLVLQKAKKKASYKGTISVYIRSSKSPYIGIFGIFHPSILISEALIDTLNEKELEAILLHEIGHVRFMDNLWSMVLGAIKDLFFFLIPLRILYKVYEEEKEYAVDKWVIDIQGDPLPLAHALIKVSSGRRVREIPSSLTLVPADYSLSRRIKNILEVKEEVIDRKLIRGISIVLLSFVLISFTLGVIEGKNFYEKNARIKCIVTSGNNSAIIEEFFECPSCVMEH